MVKEIIHQIVFNEVSSDLIKTSLKSWDKLIPFGFTIKVWSYEDIDEFIKKKYAFAYHAFKNARNFGEAGDIARYLIIFHFGGYYTDWDIQLNDPTEFVEIHGECENGYLLIDPCNGSITSEYFSAREKEGYLFEVVKDIVETYDRGERQLMQTPQFSGPFRLKCALERHPITSQSFFNVKDIFEYDYSEIREAKEFGKSGVMTHFWTHMWMD